MRKIQLAPAMAAFALAASVAAHAQTVDEIINKHVTAMGGIDNWRKVNSIVLTGVIKAGPTELPITITTLNKKGNKAEFTINGMTNYNIITPTEGWTYMPIQGMTKPEAMPADLVKESVDELDVTMDNLIDYKAKEKKVTLLGKDDVEGTECYKIKIVSKSGKEETDYIDAATYYCIRAVEKSKASGKEEESVNNMSNFQKTPEGVVVPMSFEADGAPIEIKKVEINTPVAEAVFKPASK